MRFATVLRPDNGLAWINELELHEQPLAVNLGPERGEDLVSRSASKNLLFVESVG